MKLKIFILLIVSNCATMSIWGQAVNLRYCPASFSRNNGNGQEVKVFAPNILPGSIYAQLAQKSGNQGNLFFNWDATVVYAPVINRTWLTGSDGITVQNWAFAESAGTYFNPPGVPNGGEVAYTFYRENLPPAQYITLEFVDPIDANSVGICTYDFSAGTSGSLITTDVSSGSDGGLESKSIGTALAERLFNREIKNKNATIEYTEMKQYAQMKIAANDINEFIPNKTILGPGYQSYETSPKDITTFTNAKNVVAVDYVFAGINKAVVFCTFTEGSAYTHTKQVCDRLKGSELLVIDTTTLAGMKGLKHIYKKKNNSNEYAITFTVGKNKNTNKFTFQSEWLIDNIKQQDSLYNFQIWSSDPSVLNKLFNNVIENFSAKASLTQAQVPEKPIYYVTKAYRDLKNPYLLNLLIRNNGEAKGLTIKVNSKANEQSQIKDTKEYIFDINPKGETIIQLKLFDTAESEISLKDASNAKNTDFVYSNDGIWNYYMPNNEKPEEFQVRNGEGTPQASGEYQVFRNVVLKAKTKEYITLYRVLNGGAEASDMSAYKAIKFTINGQTKVRIRLIKKGIKNYADQFQYTLETGNITKTYLIPFQKFTSSKADAKLVPTDLENISFSFENDGVYKEINVQLSDLKFVNDLSQFSENQFVLANELEAPSIAIGPNPATSFINIGGNSTLPEQINIEIFDATGKILSHKILNNRVGKWTYTQPTQGIFLPGLYIVRVKKHNGAHISKILIQ